MMLMPRAFTFFLSMLFTLSACSSLALAPTPTLTSPPPASPTPSASVAPTQRPLPSAASTATPIPISAICTPLTDHDLALITNYISHPYADPIGSNLETGHHGVDFSYYAKDGSGPPIDNNPVQSMLDGRVVGVGLNRLPYGNMLIIETRFENLPAAVTELFTMQPGNSLYLLYGHMLEIPNQQIGDQVSCGQRIGIVGNSGFSGNPHLHLETRVGPSGLDLPTMIFYETTATLAEQAAYNEWRTGETFTLFDPTDFLILAGEQ